MWTKETLAPTFGMLTFVARNLQRILKEILEPHKRFTSTSAQAQVWETDVLQRGPWAEPR